MCKYTGVSYRQGMIVSAKAGEADADARRSVAEARAIGLAIINQGDAYLEAIKSCISECLPPELAGNISIKESDTVRSRFDPGLILDFQKLAVTTKFGELSARTCLTVCSNEMQSKIWTRIVFRPDNQVLENGGLSTDQLGLLYSASDRIAAKTNEAIRNLYEADFKSVVGNNISLKSSGILHVFAVDCHGNGIGSSIQETYSELSWSETSIDKLADRELSDALRDITGVKGIPQQAKDADENDARFLVDSEAMFVPYMSSKKDTGVFVSYTNDDTSYCVGLVDSAGVISPTRDMIASQYATAEIASLLGRQF